MDQPKTVSDNGLQAKINKNLSSNKEKESHLIEHERQEIGFSKFLFGIKMPRANLYFFLALFMNFIFSFLTSVNEFFYGFCLNYLQNGDMPQLKLFCLFLGFLGILNFIFSILVGVFFKKHSNNLCEKYKMNYYSIVLKQDFQWYNKQDLNKLSESIKSDIEKIELGVIKFFNFCELK